MKHTQVYSALMMAGDSEKMLSKIGTLDAGMYIINLEDGVSEQNKLKARMMVKEAIFRLEASVNYCVRVNALDEGGLEDIKELNIVKAKHFRIPKVRSVDDVKKALDAIGVDAKLSLSIETKEAQDCLRELKISSKVESVYLGILDLFESLKMPQYQIKRENPMVGHIYSKFILDAKMAGLEYFAPVYQEHENLEEFRKWCEFEKMVGFAKKGCISPKQTAIANEIFATDDEVIAKSLHIIKAFEENSSNGIGGFVDERYGFIDEPIYKDAKLILQLLK